MLGSVKLRRLAANGVGTVKDPLMLQFGGQTAPKKKLNWGPV